MTLANKAYENIRRDIITGELEPERPLRLADLRERYGMGFSPLREALNRLHSERFVDAADLKGFRVGLWSVSQMRDAIDTRIEIETAALRASIRNGDDAWESEILATLHALNRQADRVAEGGDFWELEARHLRFHRALISACGSDWKLRFFDQLYHATERYRVPVLLSEASSASRDIKSEHTTLANSAIGRKDTIACKQLTAHYERTARWIESRMSNDQVKEVDCLLGSN